MTDGTFLLQESSRIHSNANLGVHGQGLLNLTGPGNCIEAQRLVLSLFYGVNVNLSGQGLLNLSVFFSNQLISLPPLV